MYVTIYTYKNTDSHLIIEYVKGCYSAVTLETVRLICHAWQFRILVLYRWAMEFSRCFIVHYLLLQRRYLVPIFEQRKMPDELILLQAVRNI